MVKNLKELQDKEDQMAQDPLWRAHSIRIIEDMENLIRKRIQELETNPTNIKNRVQINILKELLGYDEQ